MEECIGVVKTDAATVAAMKSVSAGRGCDVCYERPGIIGMKVDVSTKRLCVLF